MIGSRATKERDIGRAGSLQRIHMRTVRDWERERDHAQVVDYKIDISTSSNRHKTVVRSMVQSTETPPEANPPAQSSSSTEAQTTDALTSTTSNYIEHT